MKTAQLTFAPVLACLLLLAQSCATPRKTAYVTLQSVGLTADTAMRAVADLKVNGKLSDADWEKVKVRHAKFLTAYNLAIDAAANDAQKWAPDSLLAIHADLMALIQTLLPPKP